MTASFTARTWPDKDGVYLGLAKGGVSFAILLDLEDIARLKEVIESATR